MSIRRTLTAEPINRPSNQQIRRKIKQSKTVEGFVIRPGYVYTVVRAISARVNQNYDGWPSSELKKAVNTFVGKPVFVNHTNDNPETARGVVVAARYVENGADKYIECVQEIDAKRYPKVAHEIVTGGLDSVSMGAEAGFTICSFCGNKAVEEEDLCDHVKYSKGEHLRKHNKRTGKVEDVLIYESCHKLNFFELSYVFDPADETAVASKVLVGSRKKKTAAGQGDMGSYWDWYQGEHPEGVHPHSVYDFSQWYPKHIDPSANPRDVHEFAKNDAFAKGIPQQFSNYDGTPASTQWWNHDFDEDEFGEGGQQYLFPENEWHDQVGSPDDRKSSGGFGTFGSDGETHFQPNPIHQPKGHNYEDFDPDTDISPFDPRHSLTLPPGENHEGWDPDDDQDPFDPRMLGASRSFEASVLKTAGFEEGENELSWMPHSDEPLKHGDVVMFRGDVEGGGIGRKRPNDPRAIVPTDDSGGPLKGVVIGDPEKLNSGRPGHLVYWQNPGKPDGWYRGKFDGDNSFHHPEDLVATGEHAMFKPSGEAYHSQSWKGEPFLDTMRKDFQDSGKAYSYDTGPAHDIQRWNPDQDPFDPRTGWQEDWKVSFRLAVLRAGGYDVGDDGFENRVLTAAGMGDAMFKLAEGAVLNPPDDLPDDYLYRYYNESRDDPFHSRVLASAGIRTASEDLVPGFVAAPGANPIDPNKPVYVHTNRHAVNRQRETGEPQPDIWSIKQTDKETGKHVRGYAPEVHMVNNTMSVQKSGSKMFREKGQRAVHAGVTGYLAPPPDEPQDYSLMDYHPGFHESFVHRDTGEPAKTADRVHFTQQAKMYGAQADNWGRDHPPQLLFPPEPTVNAANTDTIGGEPGDRPPRFTAALRRDASFEQRVLLAYGETEAPASFDTLREEGSEPEDDTDDFYHYVSPPPEMGMPDLSEAAQVDRDQEGDEEQGGAPGGQPQVVPGPAQQPQQQYIELKVPLPPQDGQQQPQIPMQAFSALENTSTHPSISRTPKKGTADMGRRSSLAERGRVASRGRRRHADGPLVDGGDRSRNDLGEQEEAFITQVPPEEPVQLPNYGDPISNTENNLVARVQRGRQQLLADAQSLASYRDRQRWAGVDGDADTVVNPTVADSDAEALTGDDFQPLEEQPRPTNPHDASLKVFEAFDHWLTRATGQPSRNHTEASIKRHAATFANRAEINPQLMFPALGIVLREARKIQARRGAMYRQADEKLEVAAPGARADVEAPVSGDTDADAQASQFDSHDFGNNAGDDQADPDLSTDSQFWTPGEGKKEGRRAKTAGGLLAMRCAEAYIAAGLEPDTRERKYQLAAEFQNMNRGTVLDRVALTERFAAVRASERSRRVASGGSRGAAKSPVPPGLSSGVARVASRKVAAHDPTNDSLLFG